jgi:ADP-ribose pyrophosphatase YjhB (NUDIX family)
MLMKKVKFYYKDNNAPLPNQPASIGVVAIIEQDNKILLEKRRDSNRWAIIGGAIRNDESLLDGLYREVKEETGLEIRQCEIFGTFSDPTRIIEFPNGSIRRIITIAYRVQVEPYKELICSNESLELKFMNEFELDRLLIAETHIPIIKHYKMKSRVVLE